MVSSSLSSFFEDIKNKVLFSFGDHEFDRTQVALLKETFALYKKKSEVNLFGSSIFVFYFILKTWKKEFNEQAKLLGSFCTLYIISADLFDDVQDDDLKGKPHEKVGVPIAVNNAITLLFLSLDFLVKAIELEKDSEKKLKYLKAFNTASLLAVKGQHKDLIGIDGAKTTQEVLEMQKEKASSISLIAQCAAIFSDCNDAQIKKYQNISEQMVLIFQIVDDIKDIYGKKLSPDLITNKNTYPIACFLEHATEEEIVVFNELKKSLPSSMREIRDLIYNSGAIRKASETIEELRKNIHKDLSSMNIYNPSIRTMLHTIDSLASSLYTIPTFEESKFILQPEGKWHKYIKGLANNFFVNMKAFNPPEIPSLLPWHLPQWMYVPKRNVIFYPDIEGQPEDILPLQANILGVSDLEFVKEMIIRQSSVVVVHELFHYWRNVSGKLTQDSWYEEWVANTLAIDYVKKFIPELGKKTKLLLEEILSLNNKDLSDKGKEILNKFFLPDYKPNLDPLGYEVNLEEMLLIQTSMINKLCEQDFCLEENIKKFL